MDMVSVCEMDVWMHVHSRVSDDVAIFVIDCVCECGSCDMMFGPAYLWRQILESFALMARAVRAVAVDQNKTSVATEEKTRNKLKLSSTKEQTCSNTARKDFNV